MASRRRRGPTVGVRWDLPFTGLVSFLRSPSCTDLDRLDADIAVLGVPSDEGSPWKPGARFAPRKIRELSLQFAGRGTVDGQRGYYDIGDGHRYLDHERIHRRLVDCGDVDIIYTNVRRTFDNITSDVGKILAAGAFPVVIGGDHAITYPVVRAYRHPLHVLHFDAHMDYRPFVHGVQWANGNPIRNVAKLATVGSIVQVGIRSLRTRQADVEDSRARGNDIVTIPECRRRGPAGVLERLPRNEPVYVSIDIDVLDLPLVPPGALRRRAPQRGGRLRPRRGQPDARRRLREHLAHRRAAHHGVPGAHRRASAVPATPPRAPSTCAVMARATSPWARIRSASTSMTSPS